MTMPPEPVQIPAPPDFPIEWSGPEEQGLPFLQDRQHAPNPMTPLTGAIQSTYWATGSSTGIRRNGQPLQMTVRRINTYLYMAIAPTIPPEQMAEHEAEAEAGAREALGTFVDRWDNEWVPEAQGFYEVWDGFDLTGSSNAELLDHVEWSLQTYERIWEIHFEVAVGFMLAPSMFQDFYADVMETDDPLAAYKLLQGVENKSLVSDRALWDLSRAAFAEPAIAELIRTTPTDELMPTLEASPSGGQFLEAMRGYLAEFGRRSDTVIELGDPSWVESPGPAIENLKHYLAPDAHDPMEQWNGLVAEREQLVAEARERLANYPEPVKQQFEMLLVAGQQGHRVQEDHNWWLDQGSLHYLRRVFLEVGRRLAASGVIADGEDVFYLLPDEIRESIATENGAARADVVGERKAEMERFSKITPPPAAGTDYGPPPDNPMTRSIGRFFGGPPPAPSADEPNLIQGNPGAPGTVRGPAKVIITLSEAGKLEKGDVLVTATTSPPWTPLFATAAAVVADTGGVLSHCAIVAREYGIPAVLGTGRGTASITDGTMLEVNGNTGEVRVID